MIIIMIVYLDSAPEITEPPHNVVAVDGKSVNISCKNFGVPKPYVKWTRKNIELMGNRYLILDNGDLQIRYVKLYFIYLSIVFF